jgi:hypothetical protein
MEIVERSVSAGGGAVFDLAWSPAGSVTTSGRRAASYPVAVVSPSGSVVVGVTTRQVVDVFNGHLRLPSTDGGRTRMWHRLARVLGPRYAQIHRPRRRDGVAGGRPDAVAVVPRLRRRRAETISKLLGRRNRLAHAPHLESRTPGPGRTPPMPLTLGWSVTRVRDLLE